MNDVITIGDAMIAFNPHSTGPMKYVNAFEKNIGGAELNVALGCARLGLQAGWISRLGNDEFGKYIRNFVRGEGIDISQLALVDGYPTSLNFKEIMEDGSVRTFYYRDNSPTLTMTPESLDESYFRSAKMLHITGIFPAIDDANIDIIKQAIHLAKKHHLKVVLDPNIRLKLWNRDKARNVLSEILPDIDILLAGTDEMEMILGVRDSDEIIEKCKDYNIEFVAIKQGEDGCVGFCNGEVVSAEPVEARKVVDTVGAGDGFNAGVIYGILNEWPLDKILHFANTIGSMVVGVKGDNEGLPYLEDVLMNLGQMERIER